jgi:hypothetical protein
MKLYSDLVDFALLPFSVHILLCLFCCRWSWLNFFKFQLIFIAVFYMIIFWLLKYSFLTRSNTCQCWVWVAAKGDWCKFNSIELIIDLIKTKSNASFYIFDAHATCKKDQYPLSVAHFIFSQKKNTHIELVFVSFSLHSNDCCIYSVQL